MSFFYIEFDRPMRSTLVIEVNKGIISASFFIRKFVVTTYTMNNYHHATKALGQVQRNLRNFTYSFPSSQVLIITKSNPSMNPFQDI